MAMLCYLGLISYAAQIHDIGTRVSNMFSLILTAVVFKLVVGSELPVTSYNTLLDIYVTGCIFILALMAIGSLVADQVSGYNLGTDDHEEFANSINSYLLYGFASLITLFVVGWYIGSRLRVRSMIPKNCQQIRFDPNATSDFTYFFSVTYENVRIWKDGIVNSKLMLFYREGACIERPKLSIKTEKKRALPATSVSEQRVLNIVHFNDVYNIDATYKEEPVGGNCPPCVVLPC